MAQSLAQSFEPTRLITFVLSKIVCFVDDLSDAYNYLQELMAIEILIACLLGIVGDPLFCLIVTL